MFSLFWGVIFEDLKPNILLNSNVKGPVELDTSNYLSPLTDIWIVLRLCAPLNDWMPIFTLQSAGEDYNEFGVNLGRALNHYQFMSYRQAETLVSFSEGMKGPLSVFFTAVLNSLVPHLCAQPSAWLPLFLCQFYWLDISHMVVIVDGHVQAEPRYWSRHTKQILFMLTSCWW